MTGYKPKERQELEELYRKQNVRINELEQENKKLKEENKTQKEYYIIACEKVYKLEEENETLKANVEFLHSCLDDRENSIELMKEELEQYKKQYEHSMGED